MVEYLITKGANAKHVIPKSNRKTTSRGRSLLHMAAIEGRLETIKVLLKHGIDPTLKDSSGETAYQIAKRRNHAAAAKLLEPKAK